MDKPIRVYADGVFDLTHFGHYCMLQQARELGDELIIGVHLDEDGEKYKRTPILTHQERTENIRMIMGGSEVIVAPLYISEEFMTQHDIDIVAHAHTVEDEERYAAMYAVPMELGKFRRLEYTSRISTTDIIARVLGRTHLNSEEYSN